MEFLTVVFLLSLLYIFIIRFLSEKVQKRKETLALQKRLLNITKEEIKAIEKNDVKRLDDLKREKEMIYERMKDQMKRQFLYVISILLIFYIFLNIVSFLDPYTKDDLVFLLNNTSFNLSVVADNVGVWNVYIFLKGKSSPEVLSFSVSSQLEHHLSNVSSGGSFWIDKMHYSLGENVTLHGNSDKVVEKVVFDRGTRPIIYLPFSVFGIRYIEGDRAVFIFIAFLSSLLLSILLNLLGRIKP